MDNMARKQDFILFGRTTHVSEILLGLVVLLSIPSLLHFSIFGIPVLKSATLILFIFAALKSAPSYLNYNIIFFLGLFISISSIILAALNHFEAFIAFENWIIRPAVAVALIIFSVTFLFRFNYNSELINKCLSIAILVLLSSLLIQSISFLLTGLLIDYPALLGLGVTRSLFATYDLTYHRFSGLADEPAVYALTMFLLLIAVDNNKSNRTILISAEISIVLTMSILGWILFFVLQYWKFLNLPLRQAIFISLGTVLLAAASLLALYPVAAVGEGVWRLFRILFDPSANVRLFAFLPTEWIEWLRTLRFLELDGPSESTVIAPKHEVIVAEQEGVAVLRTSNAVMILTLYGKAGVVVCALGALALAIWARRILLLPVVAALAIASASLTEPLFWFSMIAMAHVARRSSRSGSKTAIPI